MLIKLTNAVAEHDGNTLLLNSELIVSIFKSVNEAEKGITYVFGINNNTWQVKETPEEIFDQVKG